MSRVASCPSSALVEHALGLIAGAEIERSDTAQRLRIELDKWRTASAANDAAYEEALRQWNALGEVAPALRDRYREPARPASRGRRRAGAVIAAGAFVIALSGALAWHLRQPVFERTMQTGTAELAQLPLPDGSRIDLNAKTALGVTLYRDRRVVALKQGEARFEIAADPTRPFRIETREGVVEVVGTVFTVSDRGQRVVVDVERGRVRVLPSLQSRMIELTSGERVSVDDGVPGAVLKSSTREFAPWRDGWLVFDNERLADALPAINAFRETPIRLGDQDAGTLRFTGRFRAADSHGLLTALPRILPVQVVEQGDGHTEIRSR